MEFLYEKRVRNFFLCFVALCVFQVCFMGLSGLFQAQVLRRALMERELGAASYLLDRGVPSTVLASAWNHREGTEAGRALLEKIGHTEQNRNYIMLLAEETSVPVLRLMAAEGILFSAILLLCLGIFLRGQERMYEKAEKIIAEYAEGRFDTHLWKGGAGAFCRLSGQVEQLALSLQAKGEAERKAKKFLQDMISDISHQLKTPLAAGEADNPETVRTFSQKSLASLERMEQLIQALLKMARLDTGNIVFEKKKCFISEITMQAAGELFERARREQKEIIMEGLPDACLYCDPEWTGEAVGNLIKNALDHTKAGGTIKIAWERSPAIFRLTVTDNGCGIAPEDIYHIFKRFYRSRSSCHRQGAGLGLSLAKAIVEGQGGTLSVESSPGEGSAFRISFPVS